MASPVASDITTQLLADGFSRQAPDATALSDPIADTPMVITLDQLRPYELDPRITRNPQYEEIKASIKERGLDAAPTITRRPGETHFIIRNGGNTRLAILRELWSETKDERFFRISCLFRPWPTRGEIVALTGHLAENEVRGDLTFIERALGVDKARELYEAESGNVLSQSELARRLSADGYPIQQSHISRMHDAIHYLLPAIPNVLYAGLGRHQIEKLAVMRRAAERIWTRHSPDPVAHSDFDELFHEVLSQFDLVPAEFSPQRVQDELIGQLADLLDVAYDTLSLDLTENESRQRALSSEPAPTAPPKVDPTTPSSGRPSAPSQQAPIATSTPRSTLEASPQHSSPPALPLPRTSSPEAVTAENNEHPATEDERESLVQEHIVSPATTTDRLQSIQHMVAGQLGDHAPPDFRDNVLQAIPVQAGGLYPISDVWYIEPGLDVPERLRIHIAQFAREIADDALLSECVTPCSFGIGYQCSLAPIDMQPKAHATLQLLTSLSASAPSDKLDSGLLTRDLPILLYGGGETTQRLSDTALVKLFRLLRLARRLWDLEAEKTEAQN